MTNSKIINIKGIQSSRRVWINREELLPRESQAVYNHSPDGFNWGYGGSGPAQLALAILLKYTTKEEAFALYQKFKREIIISLPADFNINMDVADWINKER